MKILFLTKRYYMKQDLLNKYGRFYEIPIGLSILGHAVDLVCHNYYKDDEKQGLKENANLNISSWNLGRNPVSGFWRHYRRLREKISESRPDLIVAASDCYQIIIGAAIARRFSIPMVADLYDNFLAYKASRVPGVRPLFARSIRQASAVTVISNSLIDHIRKIYLPKGKLYLVENAVTGQFLSGRDRMKSRQKFRFETGKRYIGTAGDLSSDKGIDGLINTFLELVKEYPDLQLVLAGRKHRKLQIPDMQNIHYFGQLDHDQIPDLFSALDVGVVCVRNDDFGRYCFPQKYYEMVACGLPVVASDVGEMSILLANYQELLFKPDNVEDMKRAIRYQLQNRRTLPTEVPTWAMQAEKFDRIIQDVINM